MSNLSLYKDETHTFSDVEVIEDDSDSADDSDQGQKVRFLKGDPHLPIFS